MRHIVQYVCMMLQTIMSLTQENDYQKYYLIYAHGYVTRSDWETYKLNSQCKLFYGVSFDYMRYCLTGVYGMSKVLCWRSEEIIRAYQFEFVKESNYAN